MRYLSVEETAKKWNISERSVRNYCANGRVNGAFLTGKTRYIFETNTIGVDNEAKSTEKIDGAIATIMGLDRAIRCGNDVTASVCDERGILFI